MLATMRRFFLVAAVFLAGGANAAAINDLIGEPVRSERGERIGSIADFIIDVGAGRVLYLLVDAPERFYTFPIRALDKDLRLDMQLEGETVRLDEKADPRFRRAAKLLGETVTHPHPGNTQRLGRIVDIEFDPASGRIDRVLVSDGSGSFGYPPGVLAHGRFPPLTAWQGPYADEEALGQRGYVRRPASDDRTRLHDPRDW